MSICPECEILSLLECRIFSFMTIIYNLARQQDCIDFRSSIIYDHSEYHPCNPFSAIWNNIRPVRRREARNSASLIVIKTKQNKKNHRKLVNHSNHSLKTHTVKTYWAVTNSLLLNIRTGQRQRMLSRHYLRFWGASPCKNICGFFSKWTFNMYLLD